MEVQIEKKASALKTCAAPNLDVNITCSNGLIEEVKLAVSTVSSNKEKIESDLNLQITGADFKLKEILIQWLETYLEKKPVEAFLPYDFRHLTPFERSVLYAIEKIPFGQVKTYKEIAEEIDKPLAARAVGMACGKNPFPLFIPCHRVVSCSGEGGYTPDIAIKRFFLRHEEAL